MSSASPHQHALASVTVAGVSCRSCSAPLEHIVVDLGASPLANALRRAEDLGAMEPYYPLRALLCEQCGLVQLEAVATPEAIFGHYSYFSSYSTTLLAHSAAYADAVTARLGLRPGDRVIEIASNDGYLLQYFHAKGLDVLGVEPARNVAAAAEARGIPTVAHFFGAGVAAALAGQGRRASLLVANNVVAHVPDLNDFLAGVRAILAPGGLVTFEFHHLLSMVEHGQFDTIYHEHFQYFSLASLRAALARHGMTVVDAEEVATQGGSLRAFARHQDDSSEAASPRVADVLAREAVAGLTARATYEALSTRMLACKLGLLSFLVQAKREGKSVVCFGAAAKGTTLLNYCGVHAGLVDYAVDSSPHKQGLFLPGSRIPIVSPDRVADTRPDYVLILPWNLREEIAAQMAHIRGWGGRFVVAVPELTID